MHLTSISGITRVLTPVLSLGLLLLTVARSSPGHDHESPDSSTVLQAFPVSASAYQEDIAPWVDRIIKRHGADEWRCVVLTHELHGHMGILNVLGAKMGVRARELLNSPREGLRVVSYAGLTTPLSCFNDGLQVATGATLGRGTIEVDVSAPRPSARVRSAAAECELTVRPEIMRRVKHDIDSLSAALGYGSEPYFSAIRTLSMRYWFELDRATVFSASVRNQQPPVR